MTRMGFGQVIAPSQRTFEPYDEAQSYDRAPNDAVINRGCRPGFFAQFVRAPGWFGDPGVAIPYGDGDSWIQCRDVATSNATTLRAESGDVPGWVTTVDAYERAAAAVPPLLNQGLGLGMLALLGYLILSRPGTTTLRIPGLKANPRRRRRR